MTMMARSSSNLPDPTRPDPSGYYIYTVQINIGDMKGGLCLLKCLVLDVVMATRFGGKLVKRIYFGNASILKETKPREHVN
jgi:hypothetical protein